MAVIDSSQGSFGGAASLPRNQGRAATQLLAQLVSRCDLLQMEAKEIGAEQLVLRLGQASQLVMEAARQNDPSMHSPEMGVRFSAAVARILELLDEVQRLSAESGNVLRGEDLLSMQVAALELEASLGPDGKSAAQRGFVGTHDDAVGGATAQSVLSRILIVDDDASNREILARLLRSAPWELRLAASGVEALEALRGEDFDLILLDVLMPGMDGLSVLRRLRRDVRLQDVPVIMISGVDQIASVVACLEGGAADYVSKPFNPVSLMARIERVLAYRRMALREKRQMEELQSVLEELHEARSKQEMLIASMLPGWVSEELKAKGTFAPRYHSDVTVVFTDFAGFTSSCSSLTAYELVGALNDYFTEFDDIAAKYGLERLKTVGDAYVCVAGLSGKSPSHPNDAVLASLEMLEVSRRRLGTFPSWKMRVGINSGPVVSGIVGNQRLAFDIWGDTVNLASRMVDAGSPGQINVSEKTFQRVKEMFRCAPRGSLPIKGGLLLEMFFVECASVSGGSLTPEERERDFRRRYGSYFGYEPPALPIAIFQQAPE